MKSSWFGTPSLQQTYSSCDERIPSHPHYVPLPEAPPTPPLRDIGVDAMMHSSTIATSHVSTGAVLPFPSFPKTIPVNLDQCTNRIIPNSELPSILSNSVPLLPPCQQPAGDMAADVSCHLCVRVGFATEPPSYEVVSETFGKYGLIDKVRIPDLESGKFENKDIFFYCVLYANLPILMKLHTFASTVRP